jgi:hypothetical protein
MDKQELLAVLLVNTNQYPHFEVTQKVLDCWYYYFSDDDILLFEKSFKEAERENKSGFPSTPGQVNHYLKKLKSDESQYLTADEAWQEAWYNLEDANELVQKTARLVDFKNKGMWLTDNLHFKKREFERCYNSLLEKEKTISFQQSHFKKLAFKG